MRKRLNRVGVLVAICVAVLVATVAQAPHASAQFDREFVETCGHLAVLGIPEGPRAVEAAEALRGSGQPANIEQALDNLIDRATNGRSAEDDDSASGVLFDHFDGGSCLSVDRCELVDIVVSGSPADSADAANLLWRIDTGSHSGLGPSLALIAGQFDESPLQGSVPEAVATVAAHSGCELAATGANSVVLAMAGFTMLAVGALLAGLRQSLENV